MCEDWNQKYQPTEEKDVLISKTSFSQLKIFFSNHFKTETAFPKTFNNYHPYILFLFGPSGCGKKSTIEFLCSMFEVGYATPESLQIDDNNEISENKDPEYIKDLFKAFSVATAWHNPKYKFPKKVVFVVSNVPDMTNYNRKKAFDDLIRSYMGSRRKIPIIFLLNSNLYNEPKVKRSFPEELFRGHATVIKLKEYTEAALKKALTRVCSKEKVFQRCDTDSLKEEIILKCRGDLKQALSQLYLHSLSLRNTDRKAVLRSKSFVTQSSQRSRGFDDIYSTENTENSSSFKDREFSLFHTLGKFLYNKIKGLDPKTGNSRIMTSTELTTLKPKLYFNPAHLIDQLCVDLSLFRLYNNNLLLLLIAELRFLHENYLDFYGEIEDVVNMSELFEDSDIFHTFNFYKERDELQNYQNEALNTLITATGLMLCNITGGDRINMERATEKANKGFKPLSKPKLLSLRNDIKTNAQQIKLLTKDLMVPFECAVTEYLDFIKFEEKEKKKAMVTSWNRSGQLDEEDFCVDMENGDDTTEMNSLSQFEVNQKTILTKRLCPLEYLDDDIEEVCE